MCWLALALTSPSALAGRERYLRYHSRGNPILAVRKPVIDKDSPLPRWAQIATILRQRIADEGVQSSGLTDDALAREFGVSTLTVRQAMRDLVDRGLVTRQRGKGTFVVGAPAKGSIDHLETFLRSWTIQGDTVRISILERTRQPANLQIASELGVAPGTNVGFVKRLREADGHPVGIDYRYLPPNIDSSLDDDDLLRETVWELLETKLGLTAMQSNTTIRAAGASADQAALLKVDVGSPVLHRGFNLLASTGECVLSGYSIYHPDRFIFATAVRR